ncbi:MAG: baseplate J/gp47 family protein, partial [Candidatus Pacearchaeota archaeon]|nr:baseplate J/gp47 family protein [Candidatus Pacearchaeota archaeon]
MASFEYVQSSGVIVPDVADLRDEVVEEFKGIFGDDFVTDPETPEGMFIDLFVAIREAVARNSAKLANQINPDQGGGIFLDAIWKLTGGSRTSGTRSLVLATLAGVPGTFIPQGTRVKTNVADSVIFRSTESATIGLGGSINTFFESEDVGPIPAATGTLTEIIDSVLGLDTVTNAAAATLGTAVESDPASRNRRKTTLYRQSTSLLASVLSYVRTITGVRDAQGRENVTGSSDTIDGLTIDAHSMRIVVLGGDDNDVAEALVSRKSIGSGWSGSTTIPYTDQYSGQSYDVKFDRPTELRMLVRYTIRADSVQAADPTVVLPQAAV